MLATGCHSARSPDNTLLDATRSIDIILRTCTVSLVICGYGPCQRQQVQSATYPDVTKDVNPCYLLGHTSGTVL